MHYCIKGSGGSSGRAVGYHPRDPGFDSQSGSSQIFFSPRCPPSTKWVARSLKTRRKLTRDKYKITTNMDKKRSQSKRPIILAILGELPLVFISLAVGLGIGLNYIDVVNNINHQRRTKSATGTYSYAAVVADSKTASGIGTDIMARKRGNAIDAAVASLFATGIINAHSCGLGGGSVFVIYDSEKDEWHAINSKATAPGAASEDLYVEDKDRSYIEHLGGMASGVPGEVMGLWEIHRRLGKLPWSDVVSLSIKLCQEGVPLTKAMRFAVRTKLISEKHKQDFAPYFDEKGDVKPVGSLIQLPKLAKTFQAILDDPTSFYNGSLAKDIVADIQEEGKLPSCIFTCL
ncbi:gamma-glutamyltranspeptidase 1 [Plakobranchus ocellatus]|uniref:Gamma-glutamyltranspeptidase 1 n=1 Tax=Plakobranchus ocellatus TaxID=259542 RepID=A0AAV3YJX7_9GAST|nr:gamma-glutamyltranspeptidase 1 [Plakobranchus ocellatus]